MVQLVVWCGVVGDAGGTSGGEGRGVVDAANYQTLIAGGNVF